MKAWGHTCEGESVVLQTRVEVRSVAQSLLAVSVAWPRWDTATQGLLLSGQSFLWHLYTYFTCEHVTCTCTCLCVRDLHGNTFSTLQDLALLADTFVA